MEKKRKNIIVTVVMAVIMFSLSICCIVKQQDSYSDSERRTLAAAPELTLESVLSTEFMTDFEEYTLDQFPARDEFRQLKALTEYNVFRKADNNGIYFAEGHLSKLEYPMQADMLDNAAEKFEYIYENYLAENADMDIYLSIIPDKNMFLAEENGYLSLDYEKLAEYLRGKTEYMKYIDVTDLLSADDYYTTDTHWKQECIIDVAQKLTEEMGIELDVEYTENILDNPFYGVYCGQSALSVEPDTIRYLTNEILNECVLTSYDTGVPIEKEIYDMEDAYGKDPYEMYMSGSDALMVLENPNAETDRELIIFRDSFGSSIAPLFAEGYAKITLIDIRYIQSSMLGQFVEFKDQDVLFLYSTVLLNNSLALK